ncbi:MAG: hypothetical protein KAH06_02590 [Desulfobacterales bacterium]|nr:hypothetical protein [Desulfobacterales bacterium]
MNLIFLLSHQLLIFQNLSVMMINIMTHYQYTTFKKVFAPWYDTETACYLTILFMVVVILFSCAGISVAKGITGYHDYVWLPILQIVLCSIVMFSIIIRLIKRYFFRSQNKYLKDFAL